ncbi:MAG TPA: lysophospholipid acyltransferase family protein [Clostridia bacterium]|nr:lysophospholipid acyltransferase family protein [Clostridia bacterium]
MIVFITKKIFSCFFKLFYRTEIIGLDNVPKEGGVIICSNHLSNLDPFLLGYKLERNIRWLAKIELFRYRIIAFYIKKFGVVPVNRDKGDSNAILTALSLLQNREAVGIYPEGTRALRNKKRISIVHVGVAMLALKSGCPVIPVRIITDYKIFSKTKAIFGKAFYITDEATKTIKTTGETIYEQISYEKYKEISNEIMDVVYSLN